MSDSDELSQISQSRGSSRMPSKTVVRKKYEANDNESGLDLSYQVFSSIEKIKKRRG